MKRNAMMPMVLASALLLLGACGGGESGDVTGASSGPRYPAVSGTWQGEWSSTGGLIRIATLELRQSGNQVEGTLTVGQDVNEVAGTVTEFGVVRFEGRQPGGCITYFTEDPHLGLETGSADTLDGPVARSEPNLGGPCGSLSFLTPGSLDLRKVS